VLSFAPRLSRKLLVAIVRYDDRKVPIAETYRKVGREAERLGLPRPSYQRVRVLVHASRRARRGPSIASLLVDAALNVRHPKHVLEELTGAGWSPVAETAGLNLRSDPRP
jgi:hypothetical protein